MIIRSCYLPFSQAKNKWMNCKLTGSGLTFDVKCKGLAPLLLPIAGFSLLSF